jgi:two-component system OmpR family response regulator
MSLPVQLLLADNEKKSSDALKKDLEQQGFIVQHVRDGLVALDLATRNRYDFLVVEAALPHLDGLGLITRLRNVQIRTPIMMISNRGAVQDRVAGLDAGADDYLPKPFAMAELLARLYALARRAGQASYTGRLHLSDLTVDMVTRQAWRAGNSLDLQTKEFDLLTCLMRNAGNVLSRPTLLKHVWRIDFDPRTNVVEARLSRLRKKVDPPGLTPLIHTVAGAGYVIRERP